MSDVFAIAFAVSSLLINGAILYRARIDERALRQMQTRFVIDGNTVVRVITKERRGGRGE